MWGVVREQSQEWMMWTTSNWGFYGHGFSKETTNIDLEDSPCLLDNFYALKDIVLYRFILKNQC